jgi:hypothetical protein
VDQDPPPPDAGEPNGQPPSPYPSPYPPRPAPPHWQAGYAAPFDGVPWQPRVSPRRRSAGPVIFGVIAVIAVLAVVALVALVGLRSFGPPSIDGAWYGAGTTSSTGASAETFKLETYLTLTQHGGNLSGSGELCSVGTSNIRFTVSGTRTGSALVMTWTLADGSPGAASGSIERVSGHFANDTLALTSTDASGSYSSTLRHGGHDAFTSACKGLAV